jgi:ATP-dependent exoDNAse (exonuclease V) beta subunit
VSQAEELTNALIGTVHSLGVKLLQRFAYEAGVSPAVTIIADEDQQILFNQSLATVLTEERVETMTHLCERLGLNDNDYFDWRSEVRELTEVARANDFSASVLLDSQTRSFESFQKLIGVPVDSSGAAFNANLAQAIEEAIEKIANNGDSTKVTSETLRNLQGMQRELRLRGELSWRQWAKLSKLQIGAKSRGDIEDLIAFARTHDQHPDFQCDIKAFIDAVFELSISAIQEYEDYKKQRGLIDYTDMEALIKRLLRHPQVQEVLASELDLLLVDEFQDTSPLQLEIFLQLSRFAKYSIWVGDPKQSIYGFRGAAPALMQAIIDQNGGIKPEDIQSYSWRSRQDLVYAANAIFTKAFDHMPVEQVALEPKRLKSKDPIEALDALHHWYFESFIEEGSKNRRQPGKPWFENAIAFTLKDFLANKIYIQPKDGQSARVARAGDVAVLCRSNNDCQAMADALHKAGFKVAIARAGLLNTAEAKLLLACLKYLLNYYDSLSVAEILLLGSGQAIENIIDDRMSFLERAEHFPRWAAEDPLISRLDQLRQTSIELSSAEILDLLLEELDLRRRIAAWGNTLQRLDNVDVLRRLALQFEESCNRLHTAASIGGFLLWLNELEVNEKDFQGAGEDPDAINVLTYHKSKGLEWPIVICHGLEKSLRADVWGINIVAEIEQVDLNNILGNRWLRYWVNPYDKQFGNTALSEAIADSQAQVEQSKQSAQEENRLLYVGVTRARDYLIFPSSYNPTKWLNRTWSAGQEDIPTLDPNSSETPWEWAGQYLNIETQQFTYPRDFLQVDGEEPPIFFLESRAGKKQHTPLYLDLQQKNLGLNLPGGTTLSVIQYGSGLSLEYEDQDIYTLAKAVKAFHTSYHTDYPEAVVEKMAKGLIERYGVGEWIKHRQLIQLGLDWKRFQENHFQPLKSHRKYPVRHQHGDQVFTTVLDVVMETKDGGVLLQNSGFGGDQKHWKNKALELSAYLYLGKTALQQLLGTPRIKTYVHLVLHGVLIEVEHASVFVEE